LNKNKYLYRDIARDIDTLVNNQQVIDSPL